MKKLLTFAALLLISCSAHSQTPTKVNEKGIYTAVNAPKRGSEAKPTGKQFLNADGKLLPIMVSKNGKYFVEVISKKTGKPYKKYITL